MSLAEWERERRKEKEKVRGEGKGKAKECWDGERGWRKEGEGVLKMTNISKNQVDQKIMNTRIASP